MPSRLILTAIPGSAPTDSISLGAAYSHIMSTSSRSVAPTASQDEEWARARQVVQHFFPKAALTIASCRCNLPRTFLKDSGTFKTDKWFNIVLDDSEVLQQDVQLWSNFDLNLGTPPPLYLEIYLDTTDLPRNQTIVIIDERRQRWNACEALEPSGNAVPSRSRRARNTKVVLERWKITLSANESQDNFEESMPSVYKKSVILFRTLFTLLHQLPACSFNRKLAKEPASLNSLRPMYRVTIDEPSKQDRDALEAPLYPSQERTVECEELSPVATPAGLMGVEVTYRNNCEFRVDDAEALLSMQFMGAELPHHPSTLGEAPARRVPQAMQEPGSLPSGRQASAMPPTTSAYGSLSTFHQVGALTGTSPVSALRAAREFNSTSPQDSPPIKQPPDHRSSQGSKSSLKPAEGPPAMPRRVSVSFQPFKAGSLSSSPGRNGNVPPSPRLPSGESSNASSSALSHGRKHSSQSSIPQSSLREGVTVANEQAVSSSASSPKAPPIQRFSSSFSHRRSRVSSGNNSNKTEDEQNSSGRGSQASNQPGSGLLAEGESGSGESMQADDSNISDFLNLLDQRKDLKSLNKDDAASRDATARRMNVQLSRFQRMRESHIALSESISSSVTQQQSGLGSAGAKPSSVPPQLSGASVSTSSSLGKDVSPRTPHTPAVPSRLSAQAHVDTSDNEQGPRPSGSSQRRRESQSYHRASCGSHAIDIPTSPQRNYRPRTSSPTAHRNPTVDDELTMRAASVPVDHAGTELSLSELFNTNESAQRRATATSQHTIARPRHESQDDDGRRMSTDHGSRASSFRPRAFRGGASERGSYSSTGTGSGQASTSADAGHGRFSVSSRRGADHLEDEEPLLFTMSELEQQGRRSLER